VAGLDAHASVATGLAAKLEALLAGNKEFHELPGKFGVAVQAGNLLDAAGIRDVTFLVQENQIAMILEGAPDKAVPFGDTPGAGAGFAKIAMAFIELRREQPAIRRMRDPVSRLGLQALCGMAGLLPAAHGVPIVEAPARVGDLGEAFGIAFAFGE